MPKQLKKVFPVGSDVLFTYWWYAREHKHDLHRCLVVKQWVKVAGKKPRNFYKYRLKCIEPGCSGTEFNMEDSSSTCQGIS